MSLTIDYWGVRGSLPLAPSPIDMTQELRSLFVRYFQEGHTSMEDVADFLNRIGTPQIAGYGAATTCVQVTSQEQSILIDAGSGLKHFGDHWAQSAKEERSKSISIFLTHFHWDHLVGLLNFKATQSSDCTIHFYSVNPNTENLISNYLKKPWVNFGFKNWACNTEFHTLKPRTPLELSDMQITPYLLDHPDECWGFKIKSKGKTYAHCADTEGERISRRSLGLDLPLYQGVDLMYFDAQYSLSELAKRVHWGHSAAQLGLDLAFRENIKHVLFSHHDPVASAPSISALIQQTEAHYQWKKQAAEKQRTPLPEVLWGFVYQGQRIKI